MMAETKRRKRTYLAKEEEQLVRMINAREEMRRNGNDENIEAFERERESLRLLQNVRARKAADANYTQYAVAGERMTAYFFKINAGIIS